MNRRVTPYLSKEQLKDYDNLIRTYINDGKFDEACALIDMYEDQRNGVEEPFMYMLKYMLSYMELFFLTVSFAMFPFVGFFLLFLLFRGFCVFIDIL